ncbi:hypothetical protein DDB39_000996 [Escherichia coli]|nr:hypothetical protein [Escherichia coli]
MNHAPHLYFAWQQLVEKSQLMLRLATEEQWDELIASEMYSAAIFLIPICISFDTAEKRRYATYLILNRRFSFEF